jgi:hypothetical protein
MASRMSNHDRIQTRLSKSKRSRFHHHRVLTTSASQEKGLGKADYKGSNDVHTRGMDGIERIVCIKPQSKAADANEELEGGMFDGGEDILFRAFVKHRGDCTSQRRAL